MNRPSIDDMLSGKETRYSLVIAVAKRARQIADEAEESGSIITEKPVNLAIKDFKEHKYTIVEPEINN